MCFSAFFSVFFVFAFGFLSSWILGFLASWLLGFSASWLLGFSASWFLGFLAFCWFMWRFGGFFAWAFRILCIPSSSLAGGVLAFAAFRCFMRLLVALAFRILCFPSSSPDFLAFAPFHWFLDLASRIISITSSSLFESSLLRTSLGGEVAYLNQHYFKHHGGGCRLPPATFQI